VPRNLADRLRPLRRLARPIESAEARWFGRSLLSVLFRTPVLVVETTGRRTGRRRRTTVAWCRVDGVLVVVGGAGGQTQVPDWVANLRADPQVVVTLRRRSSPMRAQELVGEERAAIWPRLVAVWPRIEDYERRAGHQIPVIALE
jgi:deazaflavin-dependent oxidoreductase (nitroreductase family)